MEAGQYIIETTNETQKAQFARRMMKITTAETVEVFSVILLLFKLLFKLFHRNQKPVPFISFNTYAGLIILVLLRPPPSWTWLSR